MTQNGKIPFVDLVSLHWDLEPELLEVCKRVIETAGFIGGPEVEGFEKEFAEYCGTKYCVGVNSGTDTLRFALTPTQYFVPQYSANSFSKPSRYEEHTS